MDHQAEAFIATYDAISEEAAMSSTPDASDHLRTPNLAELLKLFSQKHLYLIVEELKAHKSVTPFPMKVARSARKSKCGDDLTVHTEAIADEILWWGSRELSRQIGLKSTWKDILIQVANSMKIADEHSIMLADCVRLEGLILGVLSRMTGAKENPIEPEKLKTSKAWIGSIGKWIGKDIPFKSLPENFAEAKSFVAKVPILLKTGVVIVAVSTGTIAALWKTRKLSLRVLLPVVAIVAHAREELIAAAEKVDSVVRL